MQFLEYPKTEGQSIEDAIAKPEVLESLKKLVNMLVKFHKEHGDEDHTIVDVSEWGTEFTQMIRDIKVMQIIANLFEDQGCVIGLDAADPSIIMVADADYVDAQVENSVQLKYEDYEKFCNETPESERSEILKQMTRNKMQKTKLN